MDVSDAKKLKALEEENNKLKKLLAEQMLDNNCVGFAATFDAADKVPTQVRENREHAQVRET